MKLELYSTECGQLEDMTVHFDFLSIKKKFINFKKVLFSLNLVSTVERGQQEGDRVVPQTDEGSDARCSVGAANADHSHNLVRVESLRTEVLKVESTIVHLINIGVQHCKSGVAAN